MKAHDLLPIPDLLSTRKLLCVQPHPDDTEVAAGAAVARLAAAGAEVTYVTVTDGSKGTMDPAVSPGQLARVRREEQERAAEILGVRRLIWLGYPDGGPLPAEELRDRLIRVIREERPEIVLTVDPWLPYEGHPDHRATGLAAVEAALFASFAGYVPDQVRAGVAGHAVKGIAFMGTAHPNLFLAADQTWDAKMRAIRAHASQFTEEQMLQLGFYLEAKAREDAARSQARSQAWSRQVAAAGPPAESPPEPGPPGRDAWALASPVPFQLAEALLVVSPLHLHYNPGAIDLAR